MRAYMDVLAASVRLWMILGKRGGLKAKRYRKPYCGGRWGSDRTTESFGKRGGLKAKRDSKPHCGGRLGSSRTTVTSGRQSR